MKESYSGADVRNMLEQLGAKPIAFHSSFAKIAGSVTAGVMLSQIFFWSLHPTAKQNRGWFFKTASHWWEETGLSRSEQETARKRLTSLGIVEEHLHGVPARMHFRLKWEILVEALAGHTRELPLDQICNLYAAHFSRLSALSHARAVKLKARVTKVNYVEVLLREEGRCYLCAGRITLGPGRMGDSLTFDHVVALNKGGEHASANVKPAHMKCNAAKGDDLIDEDLQQPSLLFDSNQDGDGTASQCADGPQASFQGYSVLNTGEQEENKEKNKESRAERSELLAIPLNDGTEYLILEQDLKLWGMTYPAVNVKQQLREMRDWSISHPANRKTSRGVRAFISRWLGREQDAAPMAPTEQAAQPRSHEAAKLRCWHCDMEYQGEQDGFCSRECADEYCAWKLEATNMGIDMDTLRRTKRDAAMKTRVQA